MRWRFFQCRNRTMSTLPPIGGITPRSPVAVSTALTVLPANRSVAPQTRPDNRNLSLDSRSCGNRMSPPGCAAVADGRAPLLHQIRQLPPCPCQDGGCAQMTCFAAGTGIATTRGLVPVELIHRGDRVCTVLDGDTAEVIWVGHRKVDCDRHPNPSRRFGRSVWQPMRSVAECLPPTLCCHRTTRCTSTGC